MQFPITIGLRRSRFLSLGLILAHLLAGGVALVTPWAIPAKALLLACLVGSGGFTWLRLTPRVERLRLLADGGMECWRVGEADSWPVALVGPATVHPRLTVFRLAGEGGCFSVVVAPDSMDAEDFRRLRVWLRWRADFSGSAGAA